MIDYEKGDWSVAFVFSLKGSVFPRAAVWAVPSTITSIAINYVYYTYFEDEWVQEQNVGIFWSSFNVVLGFLIVFRTQQAYARYWEGAMLLRQTRGEWFNATSSLVAFCSKARHTRKEVERFQHLLVRLMSLLHCVTLQTIADNDGEHFPVIDLTGMDTDYITFLKSKPDKNHRCEIITQWIQRLVVDNAAAGLLPVPAPILTRFFQEISRGNVNVTHARNLTDIPFPFPYAQMLTLLLTVHWIFTPIISGLTLDGVWAALFTFISVFAFWGTNYIACEIESPFGQDKNDLPLVLLQKDFNSSLWILLEHQTQDPPKFKMRGSQHRMFAVDTHPFGANDSRQMVMRKRKSFYAGGNSVGSKVLPAGVRAKLRGMSALGLEAASTRSLKSNQESNDDGTQSFGTTQTFQTLKSRAASTCTGRTVYQSDDGERSSSFEVMRDQSRSFVTYHNASPSSDISESNRLASTLLGDTGEPLPEPTWHSEGSKAVSNWHSEVAELAQGRHSRHSRHSATGVARPHAHFADESYGVHFRAPQLDQLGSCLKDLIIQTISDHVVSDHGRPSDRVSFENEDEPGENLLRGISEHIDLEEEEEFESPAKAALPPLPPVLPSTPNKLGFPRFQEKDPGTCVL